MWKLIKAEFTCYGLAYILLLGIVLLSFLANAILGYLEQLLALIMFLGAFIIRVAINADWSTTHRVRFLSGLPLPVRKLEILRSIGGISIWLIWALLLSLSSLISQQGQLGMDYICWILTKVASIFIFAGSGNLAMNTRYCLKSSGPGSVLLWVSSLVFLLAGSSIGFVMYLFTINGPSFYSNWPSFIPLSEMFLTLPVSLGLFFLGLALLVLDVYVFGIRKSYLEEFSWLTASSPKWTRLCLVSKL